MKLTFRSLLVMCAVGPLQICLWTLIEHWNAESSLRTAPNDKTKFVNSVFHNFNSAKYTKGPIFSGVPCITHDFSTEKFLGIPFNISSYALLTHLIAHVTDLEVGDFVYTLGDYHIYKNHLEQVQQLLSREPLPLPQLKINDPENKLRGLEGLLAVKYEHLNLLGYQSHGKIAAPVAV